MLPPLRMTGLNASFTAHISNLHINNIIRLNVHLSSGYVQIAILINTEPTQ